jgi:hypothetical protein
MSPQQALLVFAVLAAAVAVSVWLLHALASRGRHGDKQIF